MDKINKNPEIRFKGYKDDWCVKTAEFLCSISTGKNNTQDKIEGGKYPFYVRSLTIERSNNYLFDEEAVLTVGDGVGTGKVYHYVNGKYDLHQRVYRMFDFKELSGKYFYYYFSNNFHKRVTAMTAKSSVDSVRMEMISNMDIIYPRLIDEQNLITSFFQNLDNLITLHQKKYDKLVILKKAMLVKMFPKEGALVPEIRFKGFSEDWEYNRLENLADFFKGNGLSKNDVSNSGKYNCVLYGHLYTKYGMIAQRIYFSTDKVLDNKILSQFGDVLIPASDTTPTGLARATCIEKEGVILGGDINVIRPKKLVLGRFLSLTINANRKNLIPLIKGTTVKHIYNSDLKTLEIALPCIEEQKKIGEYFINLDSQISIHQTQLDKLNTIKKACFSKMFVTQD